MKHLKTVLLAIACLVLGFIGNEVRASLQSKIPDTYYLEAEVLEVDENSTTFCSNQGDYVVDRTDIPIDNVYLLTMSSNKTSKVKDDEIIVIWADMN